MDPESLEIVLFYYLHPDQEFPEPSVQQRLTRLWLSEEGVLENYDLDRRYKITEKGKVWIEYLARIPLPNLKWTCEC